MTLASVFPSQVPRTPELVPVFVFNLKAADSIAVLKNTTTDRSIQQIPVIDGEIKTVENNLGLEFDVSGLNGFDVVTTNLSGTSILDCQLNGKTSSGAGVYVKYDGIVDFGPSVKILTNQAKDSTFEESNITCNPKFVLDDAVDDKYKWVLKENFYGSGRVVRDADDVLYVQYIIYIYR